MPDLNKIVEELSKLTVVEAAELSKTLEEKWGVSAAAPVAAAAPAAAAGGAAAEEKNDFIVNLVSSGDNKIGVIKEVRAFTGLGLKEAKDLESLRAKMRESGAFLKITKNRIAKIALKGSKAEKLEKFFKGPTAIACSKDPITLAKTLVTFSKSNEKLKILGGIMDQKLLEPSDVAHIATLPTLNEARAKIVGILALASFNVGKVAI